jgi:Zinc carboxypeptidase
MISDSEFTRQLYYGHEDYIEKDLVNRRFKHSDIIPLINKIKNTDKFKVKKAGTSTEGRDIFLISYGKGKTRIFLWSQMHGDEATATMAIFDIFNFLSSNKEFEELKIELQKKLTIYFMPMLNPDGAEVFQRQNNMGIDINRDALRLQSDEAKLLLKYFRELKATFAFNLHDQNTRYSVGKTFKPVTISFLAPPYNEKGKMNATRGKAAKLISKLYKLLSEFIPGHIARYRDGFEPRAFGDLSQKLGTSTILIESGGWKNDPEKQFIRKLNFITLLCSFKFIAEKTYNNAKIETYESIPENEEYLRDIIFRNISYIKNGKKILIDIAVNLEEINTKNSRNFFYKSIIDDIGDLSGLYGYEDHDFKGLTVEYGRTYTEKYFGEEELKELDFCEFYKNGYTNILVKECEEMEYSNFPINLIKNYSGKMVDEIKTDLPANFIFSKNSVVKYAVINGFLVCIGNDLGEVKNGIIY